MSDNVDSHVEAFDGDDDLSLLVRRLDAHAYLFDTILMSMATLWGDWLLGYLDVAKFRIIYGHCLVLIAMKRK